VKPPLHTRQKGALPLFEALPKGEGFAKLPLWIPPKILVGVFWGSSDVQGGGVVLNRLFYGGLFFLLRADLRRK